MWCSLRVLGPPIDYSRSKYECSQSHLCTVCYLKEKRKTKGWRLFLGLSSPRKVSNNASTKSTSIASLLSPPWVPSPLRRRATGLLPWWSYDCEQMYKESQVGTICCKVPMLCCHRTRRCLARPFGNPTFD